MSLFFSGFYFCYFLPGGFLDATYGGLPPIHVSDAICHPGAFGPNV